MTRHAYIHVGFHKTGSSSIQETFSHLSMDDAEFVDWERANHSGPFIAAFEKLPFDVRQPEKLGPVRRKIVQRRKAARVHLRKALERVKKDKLIFSAEAMSQANMVPSLRTFARFLEPYAPDMTVIGYVRPPLSFSTSASQFLIKNGVPRQNEKLFFQTFSYRKKIEQLDGVFGPENVRLIKFDRATLKDGDVVKDFADQIGVPLEDKDIRQTNESLMLEPTAVLYAHRLKGRHHRIGYREAVPVRNALVELLAPLGKTKLRFSPQWIIDNNPGFEDEVAWVEQRMGVSMAESQEARDGDIDCEEALLDVAIAQEDAIMELVEARAAKPGEVGALAREGLISIESEKNTINRLALCIDTIKDSLKAEMTEHA